MGVMKIFLRFCPLFMIFSLIMAGPGGSAAVWAQDSPEVFYPPGMEPPEDAGAAVAPEGDPVEAVDPFRPGERPVAAASGGSVGAPAGENAAPVEDAPPREDAAELPRSYRGISLGMSLADLKTALQHDGLFNFRGDRDVSFLPASAQSQNLVETTGPSFIRRAFFQLRDDELFIMGYALHTGLVDHYSVFTGLKEKYGEPSYLDPQQAVWETGTTRISIERPLTVKYIDMRIFNELIGESALIESAETKRRQEFLDEF
jgi:hypothetical protein